MTPKVAVEVPATDGLLICIKSIELGLWIMAVCTLETTNMIANFSDLIRSASEQQDAQRLLFLFVKADEVTDAQGASRGTLSPLMCVDKLPGELPSFRSLVEEADGIDRSWAIVLVAGLSGTGPNPPSDADAEPYLNRMVNDVSQGQDLSRYLAFDRNQNPIHFQAA